ncbi:LytTR family transcriptional regulator DNA-binding domain-containing protein [Paenibacillus wynnii]|uniref:HTH LytTR-type domain-containing protein n=1 Tax=Paenibacillus wynnii TaxID=268407 RepID=A0A098M2P3_9BACL|nr:LytTR family transcriptional regulator DNA-binding domain-containing protein [Paenibacillus wynnii]KGE16251.1 hypothetical protein PWYN_15955 [Paenibacillus wynnii]
MNEVARTITVDDALKGNKKLTSIAIDSINFMESDKTIKRIAIHTPDGVFYTIGSLTYWFSSLTDTGYDFIKADRNVLINVSNIREMDKGYNKAYFSTENDAGCFLSEKGYAKVKAKIMKEAYNVKFLESPIW